MRRITVRSIELASMPKAVSMQNAFNQNSAGILNASATEYTSAKGLCFVRLAEIREKLAQIYGYGNRLSKTKP